MTIKEILATDCKPEEIAYLDEGKTISYIPVGICETILDDVFDCKWDFKNFKCSIVKTGNYWLASGSGELEVPIEEDWNAVKTGACTMQISSRDDNMDYEGTVLSFCLVNAAKKLGRRFGRHLNGRTEITERMMIKGAPSSDTVYPAESEEQIAAAFVPVLEKIKTIETKEEALEYLATTPFKNLVNLKLIANAKPSKQ